MAELKPCKCRYKFPVIIGPLLGTEDAFCCKCDDCGYEELEMDVCPKCGSTNLTKIDRMNGYLSYSRVKGDTRLNSAKMAEIAERKSM